MREMTEALAEAIESLNYLDVEGKGMERVGERRISFDVDGGKTRT